MGPDTSDLVHRTCYIRPDSSAKYVVEQNCSQIYATVWLRMLHEQQHQMFVNE